MYSISAKAHRDARKAIDLLRVAAIYAEEKDMTRYFLIILTRLLKN